MKLAKVMNPHIVLRLAHEDRRNRAHLAAAIQACDCPPEESERLQDAWRAQNAPAQESLPLLNEDSSVQG